MTITFSLNYLFGSGLKKLSIYGLCGGHKWSVGFKYKIFQINIKHLKDHSIRKLLKFFSISIRFSVLTLDKNRATNITKQRKIKKCTKHINSLKCPSQSKKHFLMDLKTGHF